MNLSNVYCVHFRGVLSIAWCPQDPELLMSCGKVTKRNSKTALMLRRSETMPVDFGRVFTISRWKFRKRRLSIA